MEVRKPKRRWNEVHPQQRQMEDGRRKMRNDDKSQKTRRKRMHRWS